MGVDAIGDDPGEPEYGWDTALPRPATGLQDFLKQLWAQGIIEEELTMMTANNRPCAVITGGAGLLGKAMASAFAVEGFDILLADIDGHRLELVAEGLRARGIQVLTQVTDVASAAALDALRDAALTQFGRVNRLCLNAGLAIPKPFEALTRDDWDKVLGVQFHGVLNGILSFLPQLIAQGESRNAVDRNRHIIIVSSMSGVGRADLRPINAPYVVAKHATVGLTEVMAPTMERHGIGVSVLCPGMTVADPTAMQGKIWPMASAAWYENNLLDADQVAAEMMAGIAEKRLHIFPHRLGRQEVIDRHAHLMADFDSAERTSPPITTPAET
ncbi:SDR family NAD(P)-dependent oxidoreductase [Sphingobium sp.]|uniref:SDR family NAD(P)-dependent oxidoreductase n=1 Tax=Sphingobium sp. TaxID=1912891 RepID=UPI002BEEAEC1|nr:SDR family NAD(P)-dependent oxidoreductase [Sphingobium sp.]HUD92683.1 SDR family NAD(P)-dependent oxidoreductase [Sphingobium sp.]